MAKVELLLVDGLVHREEHSEQKGIVLLESDGYFAVNEVLAGD